MPFKRRFMARRRTFRKKGGFRLRSAFKRLSRNFKSFKGASIQWLTTRSVLGTSNTLINSVHTATNSTSAFAVVPISEVIAGNAQYSGRIGSKAQLLRLSCQGHTYPTVATGTSAPNAIGRIVFYMVRDLAAQTGYTATAADLSKAMLDVSVIPDYPAMTLAPWDPARVPSNIRILRDIAIRPQNVIAAYTANTYGKTVPWRFSVSLKRFMFGDKLTTWGPSYTGAGVLTPMANHIYAMFLQSAVPAAAGSMTSSWTVKLSFIP